MFHNETNPERMWSCPIIHFLGFALADQVFVHEKTADDFFNLHLPTSKNSHQFQIREEKKGLPISRSIYNRERSISPSEILTSNSVWSLLSALGVRAKYTEPLNSYVFCRGFGNRIDGNYVHSSLCTKLIVVRASKSFKAATGNGPRRRSSVRLLHNQKNRN